ncbi:hypothetical protein HS088_TW12G00322 [Tripterygium wilfordii]|uniref:RING-type E3 ubiquitin transferase n=1 Tax=Tripterygium wilfordii TaxID=458696 RepID=A0A7J7CYH0_TRIWF|nr:uncharacterized protein LOC120011048 [Tripterygium wilfordii]KAF5739123.1 hypothetical protein HS088_TW12G00322 [Tripterygium wilfordii]
MESVSLAMLLLMCCGSLTLGSSNPYVIRSLDFATPVAESESSKTYEYERIDEVKKHCAFVLSFATELKPDNNRVHRIREELKFGNGDWNQDVGNAPIMPFNDRDIPNSLSLSHLNIVSLWVTDVDIAHQSKQSVSVSGVLAIGRTRDISDAERPYGENPQFQMWPGHSQLTILFEGIYAETKKNGGERVMCMLGNAMLPSRESDGSEPWGWMKASGSNYSQPPLSQDDQILLVLHYPMTFTLTSRAIQGEMRSLNSKSNLKYFDSIHILSQLGDSAKYEFLSKAIVSKACDPYPSQDNLTNDGIEIYKGNRFCEILQQVTQGGAFTIVPNWRCNGTDEFCSKLGPFASDKEIRATDGSFKDVRLFMQNLKCEEALIQGNVSSARVAAIFRASPPSANEYSAGWRSDPSNMTVAAEGLWKSSSGQLCMIGCPGLVDSEGSSCNSRILLYVPLSFSIKQRSIILGSFSSTNDSDASYFPLSFEKLVQPMELWNYFRSSRPYYRYSKLEKAGVLLEKDEPFSFGTVIKKSLLQYPKLEDTESFMNSLSLLSEDLTLHISAVPDPLSNSRTKRVNVQVEILSIGPLFGRYWSWNNTSTTEEDIPYHTDIQYTEKQLLMNVSAQLTLIGEGYHNFSVVFLEGLYDPHVGKMYLIGCRDVRASWNILFESMGLEGGLDCLINVVVAYPPTTARLFVNPKARISISSQRTEDDPLYFKTINLQTFPIMYRKQREDILSHRGVEGILRTLTLSFAIACISSQLFHIKHNLDSVPFISLVMLGVQALGYCVPLITGAEALFKRMASESYESSSYVLEKNQWIHIIDYAVKILVMVSFLLTLRLCQKVWKSRIRLLTRTPLEPHRIPSEKWVFLGTLTIHVIGYVFVLIINVAKISQTSLRTVYIDPAGYSHNGKEWEIELEEYMGLVQDFFLLPQVIGNLLWQIDCKPLRKLYFIGITVVRLLPHVYDYIRTPFPNPYFDEDYEFVNPNLDFFSKFGDVAIPATAIFLAAIVYIQQRWSYLKLSQALTFGHCRLLPMGSRGYERLPSKSFEAELVSGVDGNAAHETGRDDEE